MIIQAFGVLTSPLQMSQVLKTLKVGHSIIDDAVRSRSADFHYGQKQPAWPIVLPSLNLVSRYRSDYDREILFICDSNAALSTCNLKIIKGPDDFQQNIQRALMWAIANPGNWQLTRKEPTVEEYVTSATKPSLLNDIQKFLYKITPYDLRKEVQALIIDYLAGLETKTRLMTKLNTSWKLDNLKQVMQRQRCDELRQAVLLYKKTGDEKQVAKDTGFETFELMYLNNSSANAARLRLAKPKARK